MVVLFLIWHMWADFNNSFTFAFIDKLRKKLKYVAVLPFKI